MKDPLSIKAVCNFIEKELRNGTPERRLPLRCQKRFVALDLDAWIWEAAIKEYLGSRRNNQVALSSETLDATNVIVAHDANDTKLIFKYIRKGNNLFITGKAGTGKTTLLKKIVEEFSNNGNIVVAAPTGIAAKNANGVTIHSLLQLPLSPWIPDCDCPELYDVSNYTREIINNISILIIDEISMVRCDLLDKVDVVLRYVKQSSLPFGGIQLILFGDLYQLMPVVTDEDWLILKNAYDSPFFFSSKAFQRIKRTFIELKKVYRQEQPEFLDILNAVRIGKVSREQLNRLNSRYSEKDSLPAGAIRLTTHNWRAYRYNKDKLESINRTEYEYKAFIDRVLPYMQLDKSDFPTDYVLRLRIGARVMFLRNDNAYKRFVNGTLGTVVDLWDDGIQVRTDDGQIVSLTKYTWDFYTYKYDKSLKMVVKQLYATFKQFPLRLAWCVTIHKSQGLTFDKVVIDASRSFAAGQVYVALSRCRTFEGIQLSERLLDKNIMIEPNIKKFLETVGLNVE